MPTAPSIYTVPLPPSLNRTYKTGQGRFYKDKKAHTWSTEALWCVKMSKETKPPSGRYRIVIHLHGLRSNADIDNRAKPVLDLLQSAGIIENDKLVDELTLVRGKGSEKIAVIHISVLP